MRFCFLLAGLIFLQTHALHGQALIFNSCANISVCMDENSCTQGTPTLTTEATTSCFNQNITYDYRIDLAANGSVDVIGDGASVTQVLPAGLSRITWRAIDNCGNARNCTQTITVRDCQIPNITCLSGLNQSLNDSCMVTFQPQSFIIAASDNCTPTNQLQFGIRKAGSGTGFPTTTSVTFGKCDIGTNFVQVWVRDANGFTNQCSNYVIVQNNTSACSCIQESNITVNGCVRTDEDKKVTTYQLRAKVESLNALGEPTATLLNKTLNATDSCYSLKLEDLPVATNMRVSVTGRRTDAYTNGFSTVDLLLISRHILVVEPFTSFYQEIAADLNRSNSISTFDIVEGRKVLLGINDTFTNVPSWRLIRPIADPGILNNWSQLSDTYQKDYPNLTGDVSIQNIKWTAIKMGDLNSSANFIGSPDDRQVLHARIDDLLLQNEAIVSVPIFIENTQYLSAWQMALQTNPSELEVLGIEGMPDDAYSILPNGQVRFAWLTTDGQPQRFDATQQPLCYLRIRPKKTLYLSQAMAQNTEVLEGEATNGQESLGLALAFQSLPGVHPSTVQYFPPSPNPFDQQTTFDFSIAERLPVYLDVVDITGRLVYQKQANFDKGYHQLIIPADALGSTGIFMYRLSIGQTLQTGKLVRM